MRWSLKPVDSWFFREARSHDAVGVGLLDSVFPPPATTLAGAIRTTIGDHLGADWHAFNRNEGELHGLLGEGNNMGLLDIVAIQLSVEGRPLFPAPQDLLKSLKNNGQCSKFHRLKIGAPIHSDLGYTAMPEMDAPAGSKPLEDHWITAEGLQCWLAGELPDASQLIAKSDMIASEPRLGIGRNNQQASAKEGLLYQTRHLRPTGKKPFSIDVYLKGMSSELVQKLPKTTNLRLGGEGREASVAISQEEIRPPGAPKAANCKKARGVVLYLAGPANFNDAVANDGPSLWCLPGFSPVINESDETTHWQGELAGVRLKLISCVLPRPYRSGGWDQKLRKPKPLISLAAPGSIYYCELQDSSDNPVTPELLQALQKHPIGSDTSLGYGRVFAGLWID
jgi:CRISPR-associated protein Cmr3